MATNLPLKPSAPKPTVKNSRRYPRSDLRLKTKILVTGAKGQKRTLEAILETRDVSMTGVFFESTFFMRIGTKVQVQFSLPGEKRQIIADGEIVREERAATAGKGVRSGFAVHFTDFVADSAVVLASLFLAPRVKRFVESYLKSRREQDLRTETDRLIDVVVGWELAKTQHDDLWEMFR
ncbi:MAG: PilZ domain-containing protein [Deltaproteobacteria bacterium]|nr:PilZ domain-containing protein [Deltaproteobacteria bacterium]